jgi:hypothetical protein
MRGNSRTTRISPVCEKPMDKFNLTGWYEKLEIEKRNTLNWLVINPEAAV